MNPHLHLSTTAVEIPSDDDDQHLSPPIAHRKGTPWPSIGPHVLILDDDDDESPIPRKASPLQLSASFVPETPISSLPVSLGLRPTIAPCTSAPLGTSGLICLESDGESEGEHSTKVAKDGNNFFEDYGLGNDGLGRSSSKDASVQGEFDYDRGMGVEADKENGMPWDNDRTAHTVSGFVEMERDDKENYGFCPNEDSTMMDQQGSDHHDAMQNQQNSLTKKRGRSKKVIDGKGTNKVEGTKNTTRKKQTKEEKAQLIEERKRKRMEEKLQKETQKAEAAELRKIQKEKAKWEKGKFALKSIVAEIDNKVVESGMIGGHLLSRFAEKGFSFRITKNPVEKSIQWKMTIPDQISQVSHMRSEVPYILFVYEAEEFCNMVLNGSLLDHVVSVQKKFQSFTICYLTNKLMSYINKREQNQYKNSSNVDAWSRPPVEEVLAKLTTHFTRVHSRQCMDEADLSEHIVGLTSSLASCQFRTKLTWLSINANGSLVPNGFIDKHLVKKNVWLKVLTAIPKVQPRYAIAIWKKYPTMRALLNIYFDPSRTVYEKEFLLKDLPVEGALGKEDKRLGEACSKRVYRILMAQNGCSKTDDVENGADFFSS